MRLKLAIAAILASGSMLLAQGSTVLTGPMIFQSPAGSFVSTSTPLSQSTQGSLTSLYHSSTGPVTFTAGPYASLGYNQANLNEADVYSAGGGGVGGYAVNNSSTGWLQTFYSTPLGNFIIPGNFVVGASKCLNFATSPQSICDDGSGGLSLSTTSTASNGFSLFRGNSLQWQFDAAGDLINAAGMVLPSGVTAYQGSATGGPLLVTTAPTGTGAPVLATSPTINSPTLTGTPTAPTGGSCASNTDIATQAYVANCAGGGSGVTTLALTTTGSSGAATGNITGATLTLNIPQYSGGASGVSSAAAGPGIAITGTGSGPYTGAVTISYNPIAPVALTPFSTATAVAANTCTAPVTGVSMTGLVYNSGNPALTTPIGWSWVGNPASINGWGAVGGLQLNVWTSANNQYSWNVCNQTSASITSGTPQFIIASIRGS